jgi:hypothetical protein
MSVVTPPWGVLGVQNRCLMRDDAILDHECINAQWDNTFHAGAGPHEVGDVVFNDVMFRINMHAGRQYFGHHILEEPLYLAQASVDGVPANDGAFVAEHCENLVGVADFECIKIMIDHVLSGFHVICFSSFIDGSPAPCGRDVR